MDLISEKQALLKSAGFPHDLGKVEEIKAGANNRLFHIWTTDGQELVLKEYLRDDRHRLEREYSACSFLASVGFEGTAKVVFKDDKQNFGVYSFCPGVTKKGAEAHLIHIELMADWIVRLHAITPEEVTIACRSIPFPCLRLQGYLDSLNKRTESLLEDRRLERAHPMVKEFLTFCDIEEFRRKINKEAEERYGQARLSVELSRSEWRLSPADFGLHNALFDGNNLTVVDLEYFGWDDPIRVLVDFLNHDQHRDVPHHLLGSFWNFYCQKTDPSQEFIERFEAGCWLGQREWVATLLMSLTQRKLQYRRHANPDFDEEAYLNKQIAKIRDRMDQLGYVT